MDSALDGASAWHGATAAPVMLRAFLDASAALAAILVVRYAVAYFGYFGVAAAAAEESAEPEASSKPPTEPSEVEASGGGFLAPSLAQATERLRAHDVDPKRGFLPRRDPLRDLSKRYPQYQEWEWIGTSLPDLLSAGQVRATVEHMQLVDWSALRQDDNALRRAFLLLSAMCNAYMWCDPSKPADIIPKSLAVPLCAVAGAVGSAPALTHASIVLYNWRRLDPKGPVSTNNITTLVDMLGGRDEKWFFLLTVEVEARGAAAILPCLLLQMAALGMHDRIKTRENTADEEQAFKAWCRYATEQLAHVRVGVDNMRKSFKKMTRQCDPYIFYHRVRPFLSGSKGNPSLPEGVVYTDSIAFGNARQQFAGGSAAQSSILQVIDATLGIEHSQAFLEEMQQYMPRKHREYIHFVQAKAKAGGCVAQTLDAVAVRVKTKNEAVKDALREATAMYDACIEAITQFRNVHMEMVKVYIISEQRKVAVQEARARGERTLGDAAGGKGTGGTGIMSFLQPVRNETRDMKRLGSSSVDE